MKETKSGYYTLYAYYFGKLIVELPPILLNPLIFSSIVYYIVGYNSTSASRFFTFCIKNIFIKNNFQLIKLFYQKLLFNFKNHT